MSQTSIGAGTPGDSNKNPASDSLPSKTLGAESGPGPTSPQAQSGQPPSALSEGAVSDVDEPSAAALDALPALTAETPAEVYPDGPNIAPSPWELDAARGESTKP